jgi:tRNA-specific 2-thiouridylase
LKRLEGRKCRVVVAMSGGVDSSAVAGLLVEAGHEVIGITMKLYDNTDLPDDGESEGSCCSLDDVSDARRVANHLGIPFYVDNYEKVFRKAVVDEFVRAYTAGQTPNPCVRCNDVVKFRSLLKKAKNLGADYLATGHYARTWVRPDGTVDLLEGRDVKKDQSYFLAGIGTKALQHVIFPLGDMTKGEVRAEAERFGLPVAQKAESQDICFIPNNDYAAFVEGHAPDRLKGPGPIIGLDGLRLGQHKGVHHYTVGQRKGLGIAAKEPTYVVDVQPEGNAVIVGGKKDVYSRRLSAHNVRWLKDAPPQGMRVRARIRHNHVGAMGALSYTDDGRIEILFEEDVLAVTPGQQLALYDERTVLGAGTIVGDPDRQLRLRAV